jgi:predicted small lipoprotein YifL
MRPFLRVLPLLLALLLLGACGNKGPLVKPNPAGETHPPAAARS